MADAKKCDRCKKFYDVYVGVPFLNKKGNVYNCMELYHDGSNHRCRFELCEDCQKALYSFLKNVPAEKKTEENVSKEMSDAAIERGKWRCYSVKED